MKVVGERVDGLGYFIAGSGEVRGFNSCPFCGGEYQEVYEAGVNWVSIPNMYRFIVRCNCGAQLEGSAEVYPGDNKEIGVVATARRFWNKRVT